MGGGRRGREREQERERWLDEQYDNRRRVPEHPAIFERWARRSADARERLSRRLDVRYGPGPRQCLDVFPATKRNAPVLLFIHGGYWRSFDKSLQSFVAPAFVEAGAMVVVPTYDLCPQVRVQAIAMQMVDAVAWTVRHAALYGGDASRLVVAGHSAGGHLAAMLLACDWTQLGLAAGTLRSALAVSGLFDLETIAKTPMLQRDLQLASPWTKRLSPVRFPAPAGRLLALVGSEESAEYHRQNESIRQAWGRDAVPVCESLPGCDHFTALDSLAVPGGRAHGLALQLLGLVRA